MQRVWDEGVPVSLTSSFLRWLLTLKQLLLMEQNLKQGTQGTQRVCQPTWGQTVSATATGLHPRGEQTSARAGSALSRCVRWARCRPRVELRRPRSRGPVWGGPPSLGSRRPQASVPVWPCGAGCLPLLSAGGQSAECRLLAP